MTSNTMERRNCNVFISVDDVHGMSREDLEKLWKDTEVIPSVTRVQCFQKKANDPLYLILSRDNKVGSEILKQEIYKDSEEGWLGVIKKIDKMVGVPLYKMQKESKDQWKAILQETNGQGQLSRIPDLPSEIKLDKNNSSNASNTNANSNLEGDNSNTVYWYWAIPIVCFLGVMMYIRESNVRGKRKSSSQRRRASEEKAKNRE